MIPIEKFESTINLSPKQQEDLNDIKWQINTARRFDNFVDYLIDTDINNLFQNMTHEEVEQYVNNNEDYYKKLENIWKLQRDGYAFVDNTSKSTIRALEKRGLIEIVVTHWVKVLEYSE